MTYDNWRNRTTWKIGIVTVILCTDLWLRWRSGIQHDYRDFYVTDLLDGADPWSTDNNFGPLHTITGFLLL